jgi:hypothetical protein
MFKTQEKNSHLGTVIPKAEETFFPPVPMPGEKVAPQAIGAGVLREMKSQKGVSIQKIDKKQNKATSGGTAP